MCGDASCWTGSKENESWGFHALLGSDGVPPGIWTHPLGALNPFPDGEEGRRRDVEVHDAASSPPNTLPWSEQGLQGQAGPRLIVTLVRI